MNNTEYILTGELHTISCAFIDSTNTDTVTVDIVRVSDSYKWNFSTLVFESSGTTGVMSNITGTTAWKSTFTPPIADTYIITVNNTTLDVQETLIAVSKGSIPTAGTTGSAVYCSKADIQGLGLGFDIPSTWTDGAINQQIIECQDEVNSYLNSDYTGPKTLTFVVDGTGNKLLQTRKYTNLPIISISSIIWRDSDDVSFASGEAWGSDDWYADKYFIEATGDYHNSIRYTTREKFVAGTRNYQIIGSFGYTTVPAYVKLLTVLLCREKITSGYLTKLDITSEAWSDYKVSYGNTKKFVTPISGFPVLDAIISANRNKSIFLEKV